MLHQFRLVHSFLIILFFVAATSAEIINITQTLRQAFGGSQSPDDARAAGIAKAKREALEKAGTYLESNTVVKNAMLEKDEIIALAAGVLKTEVISQKNYANDDAFGVEITAQVQVDTDILKDRLIKFLEDKQLLVKYSESLEKEKKLLLKVEELEKQNRLLQYKGGSDEEKAKLTIEFQNASNDLSAIDLFNKATALWSRDYCTNVEQVIKYLNQATTLDPYYPEAFWELGRAFLFKCEYDQAIFFFDKARTLAVLFLGEDNQYVALSYMGLGNAFSFKGQDDQAILNYQQSLKIFIKTCRTGETNIAILYMNLGGLYRGKGEFERSLKYGQMALTILTKTLSEEDSFWMAKSYLNLGETYYSKGDYDNAKDYILKSRDFIIGGDLYTHPIQAEADWAIGNIFLVQGKAKLALWFYEQSLKMKLKAFGAEHPTMLFYYIVLGDIYAKNGDNDKATEYYQKALTIKSKAIGAEHIDLAIFYAKLGYSYKAKGDTNTANLYLQKAMDLSLIRLGKKQSQKTTVDKSH